MIDLRPDFPIEELLAFYKDVGLFLPAVTKDYNNRMAFNTRSIGKDNLKRGMVNRPGKTGFITGPRVLSVQKATSSRNIERIEALVGGRIVPGARDPFFMQRLEFGGPIPKDNFGVVGIPHIQARKGNINNNIGRRGSMSVLAALSISSQHVPGNFKRKWAVALSMSIRKKKQIIKMPDKKGRQAIYRVKGRGRGKKRKANSITKLWIMSKGEHTTSAIHWLSRAVSTANQGRAKTFERVAQPHYDRMIRARKKA